MSLKIKNGQILLFTGDSITDCGRREKNFAPYGNGYVQRFSEAVRVREPEKEIKIINTGISGNTCEDLLNRWADDVLLFSPDWVSIKIGINDSTRWQNGSERQSPENYEKDYRAILTATRKFLPKTQILLVDPFYMGIDDGTYLGENYRSRAARELHKYLGIVSRLAVEFKTLHLPLHEKFQGLFKLQKPNVYYDSEPVHPNGNGHAFIAECVYQAFS